MTASLTLKNAVTGRGSTVTLSQVPVLSPHHLDHLRRRVISATDSVMPVTQMPRRRPEQTESAMIIACTNASGESVHPCSAAGAGGPQLPSGCSDELGGHRGSRPCSASRRHGERTSPPPPPTAAEFPCPGPSESGRGSGRMRGSRRTVTLPATAKTSRLYGSRPLPPPAAPRLPGPPPNQGQDRRSDSVGATRRLRTGDHRRRGPMPPGPPRPPRLRRPSRPRPARGPRPVVAWLPAARKPLSKVSAPIVLRQSRTETRIR